MTFLAGLTRRSIENPTMPISSTEILDFLGRPTGGVGVSAESALALATVFRSVQVIASTGGGLPLKVFRRDDRSEADRGVLGAGAPVELWETVIAHMALWGAGVVWKERDARGNVTALVPIHPARVGVDLIRSSTDPARPWRRVFEIDGSGAYTDYEVMYIPFLSLDGYRGLGPISYCRESVGTAVATQHAAAKMFQQGLLLDGVIEVDKGLTAEQARVLKARWRELAQGVENAHDVAIMDNGASFRSIGMPAKDAQFLEQRQFSRAEVAGLMGVPGFMVGDETHAIALGTQISSFVKITLRAYLMKIEQRINADLLGPGSPRYAEFVVEGLLRGDASERAAFYNAGITGGWLTPNDVRPKENLPPVPWGDDPYLPNNTAAGNPIQQGPTQGGDQ